MVCWDYTHNIRLSSNLCDTCTWNMYNVHLKYLSIYKPYFGFFYCRRQLLSFRLVWHEKHLKIWIYLHHHQKPMCIFSYLGIYFSILYRKRFELSSDFSLWYWQRHHFQCISLQKSFYEEIRMPHVNITMDGAGMKSSFLNSWALFVYLVKVGKTAHCSLSFTINEQAF